jgi:hypothetical protein
MADPLPPPAEWNAAVEHSRANPAHILGPYTGQDGLEHMCCDGDGDPDEPPNCDFPFTLELLDAATRETRWSVTMELEEAALGQAEGDGDGG